MLEVVEKYSQSLFEISLKYEQLELVFEQLSALDHIFSNLETIEYFLSPMITFDDKKKLIYNYFNNFDIKLAISFTFELSISKLLFIFSICFCS